MVGYWIYKFYKNDDLTVIEYNSQGKVENVIFPELTICVFNPFLIEKLQEINKFLDQETYLKYLKGEVVFNETYKEIDYDRITVNLYDHFQALYISWKNNKREACSDKNNCSFAFFKNSYSGFADESFLKCFAIEINTAVGKVPRGFRFDIQCYFGKVLKACCKHKSLLQSPTTII